MTNEEVNALTDQQINVMMTFAVNDLDESWDQSQGGTFVFYCAADGNSDTTITVEDYCNNPAAMMPIAFDNNIGYLSGDGVVWAMKIYSAINDGARISVNPDLNHVEKSGKHCRALAIVYLKMKGVL